MQWEIHKLEHEEFEDEWIIREQLGATQEQAESAAKAIRAMAAMERHGICVGSWPNGTFLAWKPDVSGISAIKNTRADAILSLAEQLEGKETT